MFARDLVLEIDSVLDQLINNSELFQNVDLSTLSDAEIGAFQKTQESLLHRFLFMDKALETKRKQLSHRDQRSAQQMIRDKFSAFEKCRLEISSTVERSRKKESLFAKRKRKRYLRIE